MDLEAVIPLEEWVEDKSGKHFKHCVHIFPWIQVGGVGMSWTFGLDYALVGRCS